jgi:hypothetical protein
MWVFEPLSYRVASVEEDVTCEEKVINLVPDLCREIYEREGPELPATRMTFCWHDAPS